MDFTPATLIRNLTENPVNWVLGGVALYMLYSLSSKSSMSSLPPPVHPEVIELREFTPKELAHYDGKEDKPIFIGVNGRVYDVSRGRGFYGPGSMYGNFAGRDASRGLAKNSFDEDMLTDPSGEIDKLQDLDQEEWQSLRDWAGFFEGK
ncbi:hypothetical protein HK097_002205 [Rhizophlyctis rosea]|uniref:Cytochrome b5 heme-binding domain-containing protein n=1 Tax=Rhizophlyctis rosea TaxID=64517 RepID=A0AAD5WXW9_9FUNG|nr:hypothetical protein HK097_002205 [Rhizophlyctis rosea]